MIYSDSPEFYDRLKKNADYLFNFSPDFIGLKQDFIHFCWIKLKENPRKDFNLKFLWWNWLKAQKISQELDESFVFAGHSDELEKKDFLLSTLTVKQKIIIALYIAGYTNREIASIFKVHKDTVQRWKRGKDVTKDSIRIMESIPHDIKTIDEIIKENLTKAMSVCKNQEEIAKVLGVSVRTVRNYIRKFKLKG